MATSHPCIYEIKDLSGLSNRLYVMREDLLPVGMGGNKVRIAQEFLLDMQEKGCDVLIAYGDVRSNLCRVLASECCRREIPCYVICTRGAQDTAEIRTANSRMMELFGAELIPCEKTAIAETVEGLMNRLTAQGHRPYYIYGTKFGTGNEGVPARAYQKAYREITAYASENRLQFDYIFLASGTGATHAGLTCGHILAHDDTTVVGILISSREYNRASSLILEAMRSSMELLGKPWHASYENEMHLEGQYTAGGYGLYNEEILHTVREQFRKNCLPLDPVYTGKAFLGMQKYLQKRQVSGKNVLFLHTGGTPLFYDLLQDDILAERGSAC